MNKQQVENNKEIKPAPQNNEAFDDVQSTEAGETSLLYSTEKYYPTRAHMLCWTAVAILIASHDLSL